MNEPDRKKRNVDKLAECHPWVAARLHAVIVDLEAQGLRPRIQCAARSALRQRIAKLIGKSKVSWSHHQARDKAGKPEALACDVIDDDEPKRPGARYLLALTVDARRQGLETGIRWGHDAAGKERVEAAIERYRMTGELGFSLAPTGKGWDPCHVQIPRAVLSLADARAGVRP